MPHAMRAKAAALALLCLLSACSDPGGRPAGGAARAERDPSRALPSPLPEIVARVNGQPVRLHQILPLARAELDRVSVAEREARRPEALRRALDTYVGRELLLQEAIARGVQADARAVEWTYDQMRREHRDDAAWEAFLAGQGLDARAFKAELRAKMTVAALLEQERAAGRDPDALAPTLRAKARVELLL